MSNFCLCCASICHVSVKEIKVFYTDLCYSAVNGFAHGFLLVCFFGMSCLDDKEVQHPQTRDSFQLFKHTAHNNGKRIWA